MEREIHTALESALAFRHPACAALFHSCRGSSPRCGLKFWTPQPFRGRAPLFSSCCKLLFPELPSTDALANCYGGGVFRDDCFPRPPRSRPAEPIPMKTRRMSQSKATTHGLLPVSLRIRWAARPIEPESP